MLHAEGHFLQVPVAHLVAIDVVDLLEVVQVDVDQSKDAGLPASFLNSLVEVLFHGESVVDVGQQVELGAAQEIGVEASRLNGQACQTRCHRQCLSLGGQGLGQRIKCRKDSTMRRP